MLREAVTTWDIQPLGLLSLFTGLPMCRASSLLVMCAPDCSGTACRHSSQYRSGHTIHPPATLETGWHAPQLSHHLFSHLPLPLVLRSVKDSQPTVIDRHHLFIEKAKPFHVLLFLIGLSRVNLLTLSLQTIFYQWVRRDSILMDRPFNKSRREPMFVLELDEVLFKLAVNRPQIEPLRQ